jgi:IclR family transcriptional regulator, acetate operon repressor
MKQEARDGTEIRSVARALDLLELMRRRTPTGIRVCEAAEHLGVDSATASRLLSTMIAHGYASRLPNRRYMLGTRSLRLATTWIDRLIQVAGPPMARVADSCGETVHLVQLVGSEAVTVARLAGNRRAMIDIEIGPSYPLWASAGGRALLGGVPNTLRPGLLPPEPFPAFTSRTKTRWAELSAVLQEGQRGGIHIEEGELDAHLSCYATPLLHHSRDEKLAIAISFESQRTESDRQLIRQALQREWREFAKQI